MRSLIMSWSKNRIPLENGKLSISTNPLFSLAADLVDNDFCQPFVIFRLVIIVLLTGTVML